MRIPFALWSGVIAVLVIGGLVAREYLNFGGIELAQVWPTALKVAGVWLGLVVIVGILGAIRKASSVKPDHVPDDVAQEIQRHPEH